MYVVYRVSQFCLFRVAPVEYCLVLFCCVLVSVELRFGHASLSTSISRRVPNVDVDLSSSSRSGVGLALPDPAGWR